MRCPCLAAAAPAAHLGGYPFCDPAQVAVAVDEQAEVRPHVQPAVGQRERLLLLRAAYTCKSSMRWSHLGAGLLSQRWRSLLESNEQHIKDRKEEVPVPTCFLPLLVTVEGAETLLEREVGVVRRPGGREGRLLKLAAGLEGREGAHRP